MPKKISDEKLLQLLLIHGSVSRTATVLKMSPTSIYKRLQVPEFRAQYDTLQGVLVSTATVGLASALGDAVGALADVVRDKGATAGARVQAANALLTHCARYVEIENVLRRLDALEKAQNN